MRTNRVFEWPAGFLGTLATLAGCTSLATVTIHDIEGRPHKYRRNCLKLGDLGGALSALRLSGYRSRAGGCSRDLVAMKVRRSAVQS